jgi:hypothetical protein
MRRIFPLFATIDETPCRAYVNNEDEKKPTALSYVLAQLIAGT